MKLLSETLLLFLLACAVFILLFVFTPAEAQDGTITWSWTAPTQNEDGTPLTDLDGYVVHVGEQSRIGRCGPRPLAVTDNGCYPILVNQGDQSQTSVSFTLTVPVTSTFYSSVVAFDNSGNVSQWSNEVTFTVIVDSDPQAPTSLSVTCTFTAPNITCTAN